MARSRTRATSTGTDSQADEGRLPPLRIERNGFAYRTKFKRWESRAAVRAKPRRILNEERERGKLFFPPELVPVVAHPLVASRGDRVVEEVLLQRLYVYLNFTAELEQMAINPITQRISRRRIGFGVPDPMVEDAYKICTDEAWHAQFSDDLQRQLAAATDIPPATTGEPQFFRRLREVEAEAPAEISGLPAIFFSIVSETLISSILADIPHDRRVVTAVRELVDDHAEDEGRHHAFFTSFFGCLWPQLSTKQKELIGPRLPTLVTAFLEPDYDALAAILERSGLTHDEVRQVIEETHPRQQVAEDIRRAARATIRLFQDHGVLDEPGTREAFFVAGLADPDAAPGVRSYRERG